MNLLIYTYLFKPLFYIKTGAGLCRQLIMSDNTNRGKTLVEIFYIFFKCFKLLRCSGIFGCFTIFSNTTHIYNMT